MASENSGPANVTVKPMKSEHLAGVMEIERESFVSPGSGKLWQRELNNPLSRNFIASIHLDTREKVIGYVNFWVIAGEIQLNSIAVKNTFRVSGIGAQLMQTLMSVAAAEGITTATLEVRASNTSAIKLYEKFNFVVKGTRKGYYDEVGEDALIMWADIGKN